MIANYFTWFSKLKGNKVHTVLNLELHYIIDI